MVTDQNFQPVHNMNEEIPQAQAAQAAPVVPSKPAKKAAFKKQTSFGRVLLAANKAVNPLLSTVTLGNLWEKKWQG